MNPVSFQPPSRVKLFFALRPPPELCPAIERLGTTLQRAHRLQGKITSRDRLHNTLAAIGHPRRSMEDALIRAHQAGAGLTYPAFPVRFEWTQSFDVRRDRYPLVLRGDLASLVGFQRALAAQMTREGLPVPLSYTPHITLLWADRPVADYPIAPIGWVVQDFVLMMSVVGRSRHFELRRWRLSEQN
jgi:2'-5' RNA ligase